MQHCPKWPNTPRYMIHSMAKFMMPHGTYYHMFHLWWHDIVASMLWKHQLFTEIHHKLYRANIPCVVGSQSNPCLSSRFVQRIHQLTITWKCTFVCTDWSSTSYLSGFCCRTLKVPSPLPPPRLGMWQKSASSTSLLWICLKNLTNTNQADFTHSKVPLHVTMHCFQ